MTVPASGTKEAIASRRACITKVKEELARLRGLDVSPSHISQFVQGLVMDVEFLMDGMGENVMDGT